MVDTIRKFVAIKLHEFSNFIGLQVLIFQTDDIET